MQRANIKSKTKSDNSLFGAFQGLSLNMNGAQTSITTPSACRSVQSHVTTEKKPTSNDSNDGTSDCYPVYFLVTKRNFLKSAADKYQFNI